jgi:hypothetical protein
MGLPAIHFLIPGGLSGVAGSSPIKVSSPLSVVGGGWGYGYLPPIVAVPGEPLVSTRCPLPCSFLSFEGVLGSDSSSLVVFSLPSSPSDSPPL